MHSTVRSRIGIWNLLLLLVPAPAFAQPSVCSEILKWGIYDTDDTISDVQAFNLTKRVHCNTSSRSSSTSGNLGYKLFSVGGSTGHSESESFCMSSYDEARRNQHFVQAIRRVSRAVTDAWSACIAENKRGLSHYVRPTPEANTFSYKLVYTPDGAPYATTVERVVMTNALSCEPALQRNMRIDSAGRTFICRRDPAKAVSIGVNATSGTGNVEVVHLPGYVAPTKLPRSCNEARGMGVPGLHGSTGSGFYELRPYAASAIVYCDMSERGGGWSRVGEQLVTCGTGDNATTPPLNLLGIPFSEILVRHRSGSTWCSPEGSAVGWGCAYNFAILDDARKDYLYDARSDNTKTGCRGCNYKEWYRTVPSSDRVFSIVDPENYENVSEHDNGCQPPGVVFDVFVR